MSSLNDINDNDEWCLIESDPGVFTELIHMFGMKESKLEVMEIYSLGSSSSNNDDNDNNNEEVDTTIEQSFQLLPNITIPLSSSAEDSTITTTASIELQQLNELLKVHCYGLIFLFEYNSQQRAKYQQQQQQQQESSNNNIINNEATTTAAAATNNDIFFAQQITTNACATQALLSILMNTIHNDTSSNSTTTDTEQRTSSSIITMEDLGPTLIDLYNTTKLATSYEKGLAIQNNIAIRTAHNSFITATDVYYNMYHFLLTEEEKLKKKQKLASKKSGDAFHFVAYVPINGIVYELDGLQSQPIVLGTYNTTNNTSHLTNPYQWLHVARRAIQERMDSMNQLSMNDNNKKKQENVKFNLMAVTANRRTQLQYALEKCSEILNNNNNNNDDDTTGTTVSMIMNDIMNEMDHQNSIHEQYKLDNQRRKHNYYNFIIQFIKELHINQQLKI